MFGNKIDLGVIIIQEIYAKKMPIRSGGQKRITLTVYTFNGLKSKWFSKLSGRRAGGFGTDIPYNVPPTGYL